MDGNSLMVSFAFGMVGMGMFLFGRKAGRLVPLGAGLVLMTVPYFIANLAILLGHLLRADDPSIRCPRRLIPLHLPLNRWPRPSPYGSPRRCSLVHATPFLACSPFVDILPTLARQEAAAVGVGPGAVHAKYHDQV